MKIAAIVITVVLVGGGTFTFRPNATFATYQRDYQPCGGSTFRIANGNVSFAKDTITPWNSGSTVAIGANVAVGIVKGGDTATKMELEGGHRLLLFRMRRRRHAESAGPSAPSRAVPANDLHIVQALAIQDPVFFVHSKVSVPLPFPGSRFRSEKILCRSFP